jgi:FAD/FMN-containing dehydrogenase
MSGERSKDSEALRERLISIVGEPNVLAEETDRAFYSQDIYGGGEVAALVVRPRAVEEVSAVVAASTEAGFSIVARGGATSYTGGLVPERSDSVILDLQGLDRVVEVNTGDMYVTVEAGCTWKKLYETLREEGVRTPFWGPLSGRLATVGGSLAQNAVLWGSARYGPSGDSVLGLEVVLADGAVLRTGSWATRNGKPFFRYYGPDLTGLFLGDTGALGIKVRATLRLIKMPQSALFASFAFDTHGQLAEAMGKVARSGLASECFGMDPELQRQRLKRESLMKDLQALKGVVSSAGSVTSGVKEAVKVAVAGRKFLEDVDYSMHVVVEGRDESGAAAAMEEVRRLCLTEGREVENTFPKVMRGDPFLITLTSAIGPRGERWVPVHGIVPVSEAAAAWSRVQELFAEYAERFERHGIDVGTLLAVVGTTAFVIEPVFYWPGPRTLYYERLLERSYLDRLEDFPENPQVDGLMEEVRGRLTALFLDLGAAHLQIGKTYRYREGRDPATWKLLEAVKAAVDPRGLMNPGSLGLK